MEHSKSDLEDALMRTNYFQAYLEDLLSHLQSTFQCLKLMVKVLVHGPDGSGKRMLLKAVAKNLNMDLCEERVADMFDENIVGTEKKVRSMLMKFANSPPTLIYFTGYELFCKLEDAALNRIASCIEASLEELTTITSQPIIFVASTNKFDQVCKTPLSYIFHLDIQLKPPNCDQAQEIIDAIKSFSSIDAETSNLIANISKKELYLGKLFDAIACSAIERFKLISIHPVDGNDNHNQHKDQSRTRWLDIGGLSHIKSEIIDAIQLSIDYPQLRKSGLRRSGILLYGPPGTGKTLLAKAVATECNLNFINIKGPELLNEYVGQSEDNIRKLFQRARETNPSVIFFDEIDSLAPNRGQAGDSGGVMDRMVSQLLAEMDGIGKCEGVFIIGATNRVDLVDPSLLRPGRFDKVLEVPLPVGKENRIEILKALTRKMKLDRNVSLEKIEALAKPNKSGADFQGLCSRALQNTFNRSIELVESGSKSEDEIEIVTTMEDFLQSLNDE